MDTKGVSTKSARSTRLNESINPLEISGSLFEIMRLGCFRIEVETYVLTTDCISLIERLSPALSFLKVRGCENIQVHTERGNE